MSIFIWAWRTVWGRSRAGWGAAISALTVFFSSPGWFWRVTTRNSRPRAPGRFAPKAGRFLTRRLARIYPVHVAMLCLLAVLLLLAQAQGFSPRIAQPLRISAAGGEFAADSGLGLRGCRRLELSLLVDQHGMGGLFGVPAAVAGFVLVRGGGRRAGGAGRIPGPGPARHRASPIRQFWLLPRVAALLPRIPDRHGHRAGVAAFGRQRAGAGAGAGRVGAGRRSVPAPERIFSRCWGCGCCSPRSRRSRKPDGRRCWAARPHFWRSGGSPTRSI